ncbi:histone acetyltransferase type b catalytic subunit [Anaeramoeba flamelloides]|uniref:Histone acetyltransferase type b catalytic subunit n=1 Tax=Anaeramoeba flamelloides TaxID=1746091 RepID=A0ABQ8YV28_9EUKA|nr:histone acetyltransferase type b catalytic subunit [Anaeramoeba flamelloides]
MSRSHKKKNRLTKKSIKTGIIGHQIRFETSQVLQFCLHHDLFKWDQFSPTEQDEIFGNSGDLWNKLVSLKYQLHLTPSCEYGFLKIEEASNHRHSKKKKHKKQKQQKKQQQELKKKVIEFFVSKNYLPLNLLSNHKQFEEKITCELGGNFSPPGVLIKKFKRSINPLFPEKASLFEIFACSADQIDLNNYYKSIQFLLFWYVKRNKLISEDNLRDPNFRVYLLFEKLPISKKKQFSPKNMKRNEEKEQKRDTNKKNEEKGEMQVEKEKEKEKGKGKGKGKGKRKEKEINKNEKNEIQTKKEKEKKDKKENGKEKEEKNEMEIEKENEKGKLKGKRKEKEINKNEKNEMQKEKEKENAAEKGKGKENEKETKTNTHEKENQDQFIYIFAGLATGLVFFKFPNGKRFRFENFFTLPHYKQIESQVEFLKSIYRNLFEIHNISEITSKVSNTEFSRIRTQVDLEHCWEEGFFTTQFEKEKRKKKLNAKKEINSLNMDIEQSFEMGKEKKNTNENKNVKKLIKTEIQEEKEKENEDEKEKGKEKEKEINKKEKNGMEVEEKEKEKEIKVHDVNEKEKDSIFGKLSLKDLEKISLKIKLTLHQTRKCYQISWFKNIDTNDSEMIRQFRLDVKRRLYNQHVTFLNIPINQKEFLEELFRLEIIEFKNILNHF